jgi:hypothetical protein
LLVRAIRGGRGAPDATTAVLMLGVAAACLLMCVSMELLRSRSRFVDRTYRLVFA